MNVTAGAPENRHAPSSAARPVSPLLYPILLIAGISVIVASLLGIAAMTGLLPQAQSQPAVTAAVTGKAVSESPPANQVPKKPAAPKPAAQRTGDAKAAAARCDDCGGFVKTATVAFGQSMPPAAMIRAEEAVLACDLCFVVGSSLVVYPAAGFPELAKRNGAGLVILNREPTEMDGIADLVLHREIGETLGGAVGNN